MEDIFADFESVGSFTQADLIAVGALIPLASDPDLAKMGTMVGIEVPILVSGNAWQECIELHPAAEEAGQSVKGRTWDVLWMLAQRLSSPKAIKRLEQGLPVPFQFFCLRPSDTEASEVTLWAQTSVADDGSPCLVIMFPEDA